jgi:hypothetical protein
VHNGPRFAPVFNLPYVYNYITKLCRQQAEVRQNHENEHVRSIGLGEAIHRKYKRLKLGGGQERIGEKWNAYRLLVAKP